MELIQILHPCGSETLNNEIDLGRAGGDRLTEAFVVPLGIYKGGSPVLVHPNGVVHRDGSYTIL